MKYCYLCLMIIITSINSFCNATQYKLHLLRNGETLWRISRLYQVSLEEICRINQITDVTKIRVGLKLKIPVSNKETKRNHSFIYHQLKNGETLWRISQNYRVSLEEICRINRISDVTKVKIGTKLKIPDQKNFLEYDMPVQGSIKPFVTSHFRGLLIFTDQKSEAVYSIDDGTVSYVDRVSGFGIVVYIKHENGFMSTYSGFKEIYVNSGDKIKKNETIGLTGQLSRYKKTGLLFSIVYQQKNLRFDMTQRKFYLN